MLISTRGRYALRVMIDLAENHGDGYLPMKEVAARQEISLKYLERILPVLVQTGMIEGQHGKSGGYRLTRSPDDYRVGDILRLTEGDLSPVACLCGTAEPCTRTEQCRTHALWTGLDRLIADYLDSVTLRDLMQNPQ